MGKQRIPAAVLRTAAGVEPTRLERVGAVLGKANAVPPSKVLTRSRSPHDSNLRWSATYI